MSIKEEILPYVDGNNLVSPTILLYPGQVNVTNNGVMYTSEYTVLLSNLGVLEDSSIEEFIETISHCLTPEGILKRNPDGSGGQEGPDDYYGLMNACIHTKVVKIPRMILSAINKYKGCLNNVDPNKWTFQSFLIRQPQLIACIVAAAYPSLKNPLHWLIRLALTPAFLISACIIALSGLESPTGELDNRRLTWHLVSTLTRVSLACNLAAILWRRRLCKDYGVTGMKEVMTRYLEFGHPIAKYWVG